ncbi:hypothetical protein [Sinosporangium siamense]|uniref:hypothetical protein n=1 Tax=Sinosporangium siamense TaxID=1367973 RepID=UPI00194FC2FC|nr:hypothetical protein [Sinosporangium siamense]
MGMTYPQLGANWQVSRDGWTEADALDDGLTTRQEALVQTACIEDVSGAIRVGDLSAVVASGSLPWAVWYRGPADLEYAAKGYFRVLEPMNYDAPAYTKHELSSKPHEVSGKKAWLYKLVLELDAAAVEAQGWSWRKETVMIVLVDRGAKKRPGILFISMPDSHQNLGDIDLVLGSIKAR